MQELRSSNERNYEIMKLVSQGLVKIKPDKKADFYIDNRKLNKELDKWYHE